MFGINDDIIIPKISKVELTEEQIVILNRLSLEFSEKGYPEFVFNSEIGTWTWRAS